jgi:hypothetical protein
VVASTGFVVLTNVDGTWSQTFHRYRSTPGSGYPTEEISCPTATTCYATAGGVSVPAIIAVSTTGVAGPVQLLGNAPGVLYDISCPFGRTCTAVGEDDSLGGLVVDVFRGTLAARTAYGNVDAFSGVSCVGVGACGVVGNWWPNAYFAWHGPVPA